MERMNYRIALMKSADSKDKNSVLGYVFNANGERFGVSNLDRFGEKCDRWTVTELATGYRILDGYNRKNAIDELLKMPKNKWECMKKVVSGCAENLNGSIMPLCDFYSVY